MGEPASLPDRSFYDIVIAGAGPAGSTLARIAGEKYSVLLLEKRGFREPLYSGLQKCCGGLLDSSAQEMLARFGLALPEKVMAGPQPFGIRAIDLNSRQSRNFRRNYININREAFDKWLIDLLPDTVRVLYGAWYQGHREADGRIQVRYRQDGRTCEAEAGILVGADGAVSMVRRRLGIPSPRRRYFCIQEWFRGASPMDAFGAFFDRRVSGFYSWSIPKDDALIVGAALPVRENCLERFELLKKELRTFGFRLDEESSVRKNGAFILRPGAFSGTSAGNGGIALIGEAGGFISPSSAEGISYAFKTALALGEALLEGKTGWQKRYRKKLRRLRITIFLKNLKAPLMYNAFFRRLIFALGLTSIKMYPRKMNVN